MLADVVVNFMIKKCRETYNLEDSILAEKTISEKKVKFKFERNDLKLQVEFGSDDIANIVYDNFLKTTQTENVTKKEFRDRFKELLKNTEITSHASLEVMILKIVDEIIQGKLF